MNSFIGFTRGGIFSLVHERSRTNVKKIGSAHSVLCYCVSCIGYDNQTTFYSALFKISQDFPSVDAKMLCGAKLSVY